MDQLNDYMYNLTGLVNDSEELTVLELMAKVQTKINEIINNVNTFGTEMNITAINARLDTMQALVDLKATIASLVLKADVTALDSTNANVTANTNAIALRSLKTQVDLTMVTGGIGYQNNWRDHSGFPVKYGKDDHNYLVMRGMADTGAQGSIIFTLPTTHRPPQEQLIAVGSNNAFGLISITTAGEVKAIVSNPTWISFDNVYIPLF